MIEGLNRPRGVDIDQDSVRGQVYKVSSLASGEVSLVFHVDGEDADMALGFMHLKGVTVRLSLEIA